MDLSVKSVPYADPDSPGTTITEQPFDIYIFYNSEDYECYIRAIHTIDETDDDC